MTSCMEFLPSSEKRRRHWGEHEVSGVDRSASASWWNIKCGWSSELDWLTDREKKIKVSTHITKCTATVTQSLWLTFKSVVDPNAACAPCKYEFDDRPCHACSDNSKMQSLPPSRKLAVRSISSTFFLISCNFQLRMMINIQFLKFT